MSDETIGTPAVPETPREPATPAAASNGGTAAPNASPPPRSPAADASPGPSAAPAAGGAAADASGREPSTGAPGADRADNSTGGGARTEGGARPDGAARKRRRGSRGGRNRKRPAGSGAGGEGATGGDGGNGTGRDRPAANARAGGGGASGADRTPRQAGERRDERAAADRGLTTEDVAAEARSEAGIGASVPADVVKPRIGDTRPAPAATAARADRSAEGGGSGTGNGAPRKRRRRGGRGRNRTGGTGGGGNGVVTTTISDDGGFDLDQLDEETLERRRGRTRKGRPTGRYQMIVHTGPDGTIQMGVLEGRALVEHYVSRPEDDATSIDGNIYLGKVQNVLPGMEAAFIDIGTPKNGVIYQRDVQFDTSDLDDDNAGAPKIETVLKNGQSILVQVTKNPIGAKGARLTQDVSLAGRFVVMVPNQPKTYGISKRLPDDERKRLRKVLEGIRPENAGLIVRTAAEGATAEELARDLARLQDQWRQISELAARSKPGTLLYREPPLVVRVIREEFTKEYRAIVIDDPGIHDEVKAYVDAIAPELSERVERYDDESLPIFERFHVHEQLHKALDRKVWLPSGGSLIIERTEALTVVDVNTGKNVGKSNLEDTVFQNNLEAAEEVARQLRLRDIGGIIVIDFIDMEIKKNRDAVVKALREALARDKTRTQVFEISELGLVEMTRKRISEGLVEAFSETCTVCGGRGFVVDESML
jgi:ribonuclease E